jgi:phage terminase large subunit
LELLPKQNDAVHFLVDEETTEILYGGAAGGGKSALGVLWLIQNCQNYKGSRWMIGRSVLKTLKATTLKTFFEISKRLDINEQWIYHQTESVIRWDNGSEIVLQELENLPRDKDFDRLGSLEITGAFIDEVAQIEFKAWQVVKSRIRYKLDEFGLMPKILGTCNPSKNWTYKYFYKPNKNKDMPDFRKFVLSLPKDNPHLPDSYIETLGQLDEASKRRLRDGDWEFDDDKSTLISYDAIMDYWNGSHIMIKDDDKRYLTIDVARKGKDKTVFRVWKGFVCVERKEIAKSDLRVVVEVAKELQEKYGITNSKTIADEDGVGGGVVDFLGCIGFVNNSRALNEENYVNLKSQCSIKMAKRIEDRGVIERCESPSIQELVTEEMEQVKIKDLDKDGRMGVVPKEKIKELIGRSPDDWDSIMMREWFELRDEIWAI